jgi:hypothetical protein
MDRSLKWIDKALPLVASSIPVVRPSRNGPLVLCPLMPKKKTKQLKDEFTCLRKRFFSKLTSSKRSGEECQNGLSAPSHILFILRNVLSPKGHHVIDLPSTLDQTSPHHRKDLNSQESWNRGRVDLNKKSFFHSEQSAKEVTLCGIDRPTSLLGRNQNDLKKDTTKPDWTKPTSTEWTQAITATFSSTPFPRTY